MFKKKVGGKNGRIIRLRSYVNFRFLKFRCCNPLFYILFNGKRFDVISNAPCYFTLLDRRTLHCCVRQEILVKLTDLHKTHRRLYETTVLLEYKINFQRCVIPLRHGMVCFRRKCNF